MPAGIFALSALYCGAVTEGQINGLITNIIADGAIAEETVVALCMCSYETTDSRFAVPIKPDPITQYADEV